MKHVVSFSGGEDSTAMLLRMFDHSVSARSEPTQSEPYKSFSIKDRM